jgi:hypothetical protein
MMIRDAITCPHCRMPNNTMTGTHGRLPGPGDFGMCVYCRLFSAFDLDVDGRLILREPTAEERTGLARNPRAAAIQAVVAMAPTTAAAGEMWRRDGASYG